MNYGAPGYGAAGFGTQGFGIPNYGTPGYGTPGYGNVASYANNVGGSNNPVTSNTGYPNTVGGSSYPATSNTGYPNTVGGSSYPATSNAYSRAYVAPATGSATMAQPAVPKQRLGIYEEPVVDSNNQSGIKVTNVEPNTAAERAGLQVGDVIHSVNGYLTQHTGNLAWIIANKAPNNILTMNVRAARDGQDHTVTAQLR
jgi:membrane-associated protease RseP (regulator of RpoE activity)